MTVHRGLLKVAGVLGLAAAAAAFLAFQMTDIGHFTGFALMATTLAGGGLYVAWQSTRPG